MYKITIKYRDGKEETIEEKEYDKGCAKTNEYASKPDVESTWLKETNDK